MMNNLPTLVLGASENPSRYSNRAVKQLLAHGHEVYALGKRKGTIGNIPIHTEWPHHLSIHTITLYVNANNQKEYYNNIIALQPKRVIFNPGAENNELVSQLNQEGIETMNACTLVLLNTGQFV